MELILSSKSIVFCFDLQHRHSSQEQGKAMSSCYNENLGHIRLTDGDSKPKYNYPIKILRTSSSVCLGGTRHNLVVVVKSGVYNFEAREEFRAFMKNQILACPSFRVGYAFSIGLPRARGGRTFNRDGNIVNLTGPAGDMLEKYDGKSSILMDEIYTEIGKYDDIILADYEDTYFNLSWKTVTNLRWISAFCDKNRGDFFMIIDEDNRMNLQLVVKFAKEVPTLDLRTSI
ncbi:hypothetical protein ACTXT7_014874 [Hymenolepis weldensis]